MARHDLGDMERIRLTLQTWMRQHIPGGEQLELGELTFPEESGESSVSLILRGENRGRDVGYICRMEPRDSQVFEEHDLLMQYNVMRFVSEHDVPVPPLLGFEEDTRLLGSEFYLMGFVDGLVPADNPPYVFGSWVTELSESERETMWENGLVTLAKIHAISLEKYDIPGLPQAPADAPPIQHELDKLNSLVTDDISSRMSPVLARALQYLNANIPSNGVRRLCWGDSRPGNIIWRDLKPAAVIDWEMAGIADPLLDVSWWYWVDYVNCVGLGRDRLAGLPELGDLYSRWQALTGLPVERTRYFDLFSVTRYAIILERKFLAMEKAGMGLVESYAVPIVAQLLEQCQTT